jgi:hypothetical protein
VAPDRRTALRSGRGALPGLLLAVLVVIALPAGAHAQTIGIGVRAGTLGLGPEASARLTDNIGVRGGIGVIPVEPGGSFGDIDYTIQPASPLINVGLDFHPGAGGFRLGGGLLFISKNTTMEAEYTGTVEIGGRVYQGSEVGELRAALDHGSAAPYLTLGFGRTTARGMGLFLDLGAAFLSEPSLTLTATGHATQSEQFRDDLERQRQQSEEDARTYLRILPILSVGLRFGLM